jgi:cobalt-zinc-cadmium efflux system outer membrane protein
MSFPSGRALCAPLLGASILTLAPALAAADPAPSFKDLLAQSANAPRLREANANVDQATHMLTQARTRPNPSLNLESENFGGRDSFRDFRSAETTFSVEQTLELGGKRSARIAAGRAGVTSAQAQKGQTFADFGYDLAIAYIRAEAADKRLALATDALALTEEDDRRVTALVEAGKEAQLRQAQARAATEAARAEVDEAKAARAEAFARLTAISGSPLPYTSLSQDILAHAEVNETPANIDPLKTPSYLAAKAEADTAQAQIKVQKSLGVPDATVSLGVRRLQADRANALVGGVSMPFPIFDRNQGNVLAASSERDAALARLEQARLDAVAESSAAMAALYAARTHVTATRNAEATAEEAYRLTRIGYESGKIPLAEVLTARRALTDARSQALDARVERLAAEAALARLQGVAPFGDL